MMDTVLNPTGQEKIHSRQQTQCELYGVIHVCLCNIPLLFIPFFPFCLLAIVHLFASMTRKEDKTYTQLSDIQLQVLVSRRVTFTYSVQTPNIPIIH